MPNGAEWATGPGHWLLSRRSISDPSEIAYYICYAHRQTSLNVLVWVAGRRWPVEECFKQAKQETGLDDYRSAPGAAGMPTSPCRCSPWHGWPSSAPLSSKKGEPAATASSSFRSACLKPAG
ncbi:hypothetical protein GCM10023107_89440 [Actinoplanes octamycinicus]|nr:hypothetical protein Aoc01nite_64840 [Actinoplanes octamycinicus]